VSRLRAALERALPPGPFLFPPDEVASRPVRFFVAELVRETVFRRFHQEIPYSVICRIDEFREAQDPVYISATIYVERESQKGILVGRRGETVKAVGRESREKIEHFLGRSVYLDLWVKVLPRWRRKRSHLTRLGFHVPEGGDEERP
jgi:GTP-binding protein Era